MVSKIFYRTALFSAVDDAYRVTHLVANLGWVDLDLECSTILLGQ